MSRSPIPTDTSDEIAALQIELWRKMSPQERVRKAFSLSSRVKDMAFAAIRRQHPTWNKQKVQLRFIELTYGADLAADVARWMSEKDVESS